MPTLTKGQEAALKMAAGLATYKDEPRIAVLAGYAGTGKSYLIGRLPEVWGGHPVVIAPTGKASLRVRELTGIGATTIHSWCYTPHEDLNSGEVTYTIKNIADINVGEVGVVVIDEASMVGEDLWDDIYDVCRMMRLNILIIGDGGQLPPVQRDASRQGEPFSLLSPNFRSHERVVMTEIVRQAAGNPIIKASMLVREGNPAQAIFQLPRIKSTEIVRYGSEIIKSGGMVICHRNNTRQKLNILLRESLSYPKDRLVPGEPLLVLQNNIRIYRFNGEIITFKDWIQEPIADHIIKDWYRKLEAKSKFGWARLNTSPGDPWGQCLLAVEEVFGRLGRLSLKPIAKMSRTVMGVSNVMPDGAEDMSAAELNEAVGPPHLHCNFGYALTAHKSQGSQADHVLVCLEPTIRFNTEEGRRWIYTSITRAKESVKICLGIPADLI